MPKYQIYGYVYHTHSKASFDGDQDIDGVRTIDIARGLDFPLKVIARTDHDIMDLLDIKRGMEYGKEYGISYIPGIEVSTKLHMLQKTVKMVLFRLRGVLE